MPKAFKDAKFIDGFKGVYIPYWLYNLNLQDKVRLKAVNSVRDGEYIRTDKYEIFADVDAEYNGDYYDASRSFYDEISYALAPYDIDKCQKFTPSILSGFYAKCAEVDEYIYQNDAKELAHKDVVSIIRETDGVSKYKVYDSDKVELNFNVQAEKILYPVWFMSYRNKNRVAYATINGQTGKIVSDFPIDEKKILFCSLLLALPIFVLLNLFIILNHAQVLSLCMFILYLSLIMNASELRALYEKESLWTDKGIYDETISLKILKERLKRAENSLPGALFLRLFGFRYENGINISAYLNILLYLPIVICCYWFQTIIWPIFAILACFGIYCVYGQLIRSKYKKNKVAMFVSALALLISVIVLLLSPTQVFWYYGAIILSCIAIATNFMFVFKNYNEFTTRKMPN